MPKSETSLTGKKKAAILLLTLDTQGASKVLRHLNEEEIEQVTAEILNIGKVDNATRSEVLEEFTNACFTNSFYNMGGIEYVKQVLEQTLGPQKANSIIDRLTEDINDKPFSFIKKADPNQLVNIIQNEHPQTIALIFSYLSPQQAAVVLSALPKEKQAEVAIRIATMDMTSPDFTNEIERILQKKLASLGKESYTASGGIQAVVDILNAVDRSTEKSIFEVLDEKNSELAEEIKKRMFVFEDIINLDNKAVQLFLKDVEIRDLALALKNATEGVFNRIMENMSKRMQEVLKEEVELLGPVKLRDVEEAQQRIVNVIRRLEESGEIIVSRGGGDEIIV